MENKRFIDGGEESVEDQFLTDTITNEDYYIDKGLDEIIDILNDLHQENIQLKEKLEEIEILLNQYSKK